MVEDRMLPASIIMSLFTSVTLAQEWPVSHVLASDFHIAKEYTPPEAENPLGEVSPKGHFAQKTEAALTELSKTHHKITSLMNLTRNKISTSSTQGVASATCRINIAGCNTLYLAKYDNLYELNNKPHVEINTSRPLVYDAHCWAGSSVPSSSSRPIEQETCADIFRLLSKFSQYEIESRLDIARLNPNVKIVTDGFSGRNVFLDTHITAGSNETLYALSASGKTSAAEAPLGDKSNTKLEEVPKVGNNNADQPSEETNETLELPQESDFNAADQQVTNVELSSIFLATEPESQPPGQSHKGLRGPESDLANPLGSTAITSSIHEVVAKVASPSVDLEMPGNSSTDHSSDESQKLFESFGLGQGFSRAILAQKENWTIGTVPKAPQRLADTSQSNTNYEDFEVTPVPIPVSAPGLFLLSTIILLLSLRSKARS